MKKYFNKTTLMNLASTLRSVSSEMTDVLFWVGYTLCAVIGGVVLIFVMIWGYDYYTDVDLYAEFLATPQQVYKPVTQATEHGALPLLDGDTDLLLSKDEVHLALEKLDDDPKVLQKTVGTEEAGLTPIAQLRKRPLLKLIPKKVTWDERQFYQFDKTIIESTVEVGELAKVADESEPYDGPFTIDPVPEDGKRYRPFETVMMLKRVVFKEHLLGEWRHNDEEARQADDLDGLNSGSIHFLEDNQYRETRRSTLGDDDLFGEDWVLEYELSGQWLVKPQLRKIIVHVDSIEVKEQTGWGDRFVEQPRKGLLTMYEMDIEEFEKDRMTVDIDNGLSYQLVKQ